MEHTIQLDPVQEFIPFKDQPNILSASLYYPQNNQFNYLIFLQLEPDTIKIYNPKSKTINLTLREQNYSCFNFQVDTIKNLIISSCLNNTIQIHQISYNYIKLLRHHKSQTREPLIKLSQLNTQKQQFITSGFPSNIIINVYSYYQHKEIYRFPHDLNYPICYLQLYLDQDEEFIIVSDRYQLFIFQEEPQLQMYFKIYQIKFEQQIRYITYKQNIIYIMNEQSQLCRYIYRQHNFQYQETSEDRGSNLSQLAFLNNSNDIIEYSKVGEINFWRKIDNNYKIIEQNDLNCVIVALFVFSNNEIFISLNDNKHNKSSCCKYKIIDTLKYQ